MKRAFVILMILLISWSGWSQSQVTLGGQLRNLKGEALEGVFVYVAGTDELSITDKEGRFSFNLLKGQSYTLSFKGIKINDFQKTVSLSQEVMLSLETAEQVQKLDEVVIASEVEGLGLRQLRALEAGGLYEGKKTEVINIDKMVGNKAANNARQAYGKIPGLNIWESDNAGLQLDIGGRGLSPKRTTNFNTRQNGYDISADALGYPESYYSPPLQAVQQVEIVRGAGALQYGSQFGGLINFKMKKGHSKPINFESQNTYGAFQFFNTFNAIHGETEKLNHYSYFQYKRGDGWRENSAFDQYGAATYLTYHVSESLKIGLEFTYMYYLSQQSGGLTDPGFSSDPQASNRDRNWFRVNWKLPAVTVEYTVTPKFKIYNRTFGLIARRSSLGLLDSPNVEDTVQANGLLRNRDFIDGKFRNFGNETRLSYSYDWLDGLDNSLLIGARVYTGFTRFSQSVGTNGDDPNFVSLDTAIFNRQKSNFEFPNLNAAFFAEHIFRLSSTFSLIPGIRYEYISTRSRGVLTTTTPLNSLVGFLPSPELGVDFREQEKNDTTSNQRHILLYGLGMSYKFNDELEWYANATSNYRAVNFTDVQIQTTSQIVDPDIKDESGYSFDMGIRKQEFSSFYFEAGLFYILYNDRIGEALGRGESLDGQRLRTNIGSARIFGAELFAELDVLKALGKDSKHKVGVFFNGSVASAEYVDINDRAAGSVRSGNRLEDVPSYIIKSGVSYQYDKVGVSLLSTFIGDQFSDAANTREGTVQQENGEFITSGVFGEIPSYEVWDLSAKYYISEHFLLSGSVNNLFDKSYFTRRAVAYPGPGIIPALGRTWSFTLTAKF